MNILIYLIIGFSVLGTYITWQISKNKLLKEKGEKMVCLVGHKCDDVVFSDYSKFFGLPLEKLGFVYYIYNILFYSIYLFNSNIIPEVIYFISLGLTFGGFMFSIYLTYIQIFRLKALCSWCLSSALSSTLIFIFSYAMTLQYKPEIIEYTKHIHVFIEGFEFITIIIGVAIYTVVEILELTFLKDLRIDEKEESVLKVTHQIGWFTIFLLILNNIGVYLPEYILEGKLQDSLYLEGIVILLIVINTLIYNIQTLPNVKKHLESGCIHIGNFCKLRKVSLAHSVISLGAWYYLFYINFVM